ncbi:CLUMA_CG006224, isoform A [Clunio marinus]|uniref:Pre-mRNA-splicing factor SPF27 n=1 Tax=Clunio marinus TaxID=568069 RepID=A0A1J1HZI0_9DIPT|nr:CLUMA_CG006224, isoform A [Clunio marinus]
MNTEVLVDALPYFDAGFDDPGVRETVLAMVEEECKRYKPTKNYLEYLQPINTSSFETDLMRNEFSRVESGTRMETMSTKRYELPAPPAGKLGELQAWQESVDNSLSQLEHQSIRSLNLELMNKYGTETWKQALEIMIGMGAKAQKELQNLKKEIQDINWKRKSIQLQTGEKLNNLNQQWVSLVSCNYEIEQAISMLELQIQQIKHKKCIQDETI